MKKMLLDFTICDLSEPFCVNELPQMLQTYGFRPSCVILCRVKLVRVLNVLLHTSHLLSGFELDATLVLFGGDLFDFVGNCFGISLKKLVK